MNTTKLNFCNFLHLLMNKHLETKMSNKNSNIFKFARCYLLGESKDYDDCDFGPGGWCSRCSKYKNGSRYDDDHYDRHGFDIWGYDRHGFNKAGVHRTGALVDTDGYDAKGYNQQGFNRNGFHRNGTRWDQDGYDQDGYNKRGFKRSGFHRNGSLFDMFGFDADGVHDTGMKLDYHPSVDKVPADRREEILEKVGKRLTPDGHTVLGTMALERRSHLLALIGE